MNVRQLSPADLPTVYEWWDRHGSLRVPEAFLPQGFMAEDEGDPIACCFLYLDVTGKCSMIEYLTTNPEFSLSKKVLAAFKALISRAEAVTLAQGCRAMISMVAPGTGEERIMAKLGYQTSEGVGHRMFGKVLCP